MLSLTGTNQSFQLFQQTSNSQLLVLDIGSNDLDPTRHNINNEYLARELVSRAPKVGRNYGIHVIICLPIPRQNQNFQARSK